VEGIGANVTVGLFPDFTIHVPFDHQTHCTDLAFQLVRRFDGTLQLEEFSGPPTVGSGAARRGRQFARLLPPGMQTLIVHADTSYEKEWPVASFQRTLDAFLSAHSNFVSVVLGSRDIGIDCGRTGRIFSALGLPLEVSLALVGRGTAFLGVDSAMLHAADLFRLPSAALFGPGDSLQFGCRFCRHEYVRAESMSEITEEAVLQALDVVAVDPQTRPRG
jgi:ADP-heptose:LPS heptosyltransferase